MQPTPHYCKLVFFALANGHVVKNRYDVMAIYRTIGMCVGMDTKSGS